MSKAVPKMKGLEKIAVLRAYCDYVEEHLKNVAKAWIILQGACKSEKQVWNDFDFWITHGLIEEHDLSKMDAEEFIQYADWFMSPFGSKYDYWSDGGMGEVTHNKLKQAFDLAWENHKSKNPHHWQNWTQSNEHYPGEHGCHLMCMVTDWMAMGIKFGDTAESYYNREKDKIKLPEWAIEYLQRIFAALKTDPREGVIE